MAKLHNLAVKELSKVVRRQVVLTLRKLLSKPCLDHIKLMVVHISLVVQVDSLMVEPVVHMVQDNILMAEPGILEAEPGTFEEPFKALADKHIMEVEELMQRELKSHYSQK